MNKDHNNSLRVYVRSPNSTGVTLFFKKPYIAYKLKQLGDFTF